MDVIQLVDGHWAPNGDGVVLSDVAGQLHIYGTGSQDLMAYARYDQFMSSDYRQLRQDERGNVFDDETQTEAHIRSDKCASPDDYALAMPQQPVFRCTLRLAFL